jgi:prolyl-tRNA synthetase
MVGGLIMAHGDDQGLVVPPALAPIQVVVLLVRDEDGAGDAAASLAAELKGAGVKVRLDAQVATSFGRRATDWELKGVPVRIEVGPRDLKEGNVTIVRRDTGEKRTVPIGEVAHRVENLLPLVQSEMLATATQRRDDRTVEAASLEEAVEAAKVGFAKIAWDLIKDGGEARLAQDGITVRCIQRADGDLPDSDEEPDLVAYVARSY